MTAKSIGWASNAYGYCVQAHDEHGKVIDAHDYWAGNNIHESTSYVDPESDSAESPETLREMAQSTAKEMAEELGVDPKDIWEDVDMNHQLTEVGGGLCDEQS